MSVNIVNVVNNTNVQKVAKYTRKIGGVPSCYKYAECGKCSARPILVKKNVMATTRNKKLCPSPLDPSIAGGIISGAGSVIGAGIQALTQPSLKQQRQSKQKYDAWYQKNVTEKNMALENQYQIDAENRANAYNDPSAVAARMSAAGISPASALGGSASGAGIMSQSDAPSAGGSGGFSPTPMSIRPDFSGVADSVLKGMHQKELDKVQADNIRAQTDLYLEQAGYTKEQRRRMVWEIDQYLPEVLRGVKIKNATQEQEEIIARVNAYVAEATAEDDIAARSLTLSKLRAEKEKLLQDKKFVEQNGKYIEALTRSEDELRNPKKESIEQGTEESRQRVKEIRANVKKIKSETNLNKQEHDFTEWMNSKVQENFDFDKLLSRAESITDVADTLLDMYLKYKHNGDEEAARRESRTFEAARLALFALRFIK